METNDKLLKDFFSEHKQEIADKGFSQRVMRKLPEQADRRWIVWIFASIGFLLTFLLGVENGALKEIVHFFQQISIYYLLGIVFMFPLIGSMGVCLAQGKQCILKY